MACIGFGIAIAGLLITLALSDLTKAIRDQGRNLKP